jgi:hypothetical protein
LLDGKFDALALFEVTEALRLDGTVMNKNVLAILARDKAITLGAVEPFYGSGHSFVHGQILLSVKIIGRKGSLPDTNKVAWTRYKPRRQEHSDRFMNLLRPTLHIISQFGDIVKLGREDGLEPYVK